MCLLGIHTRDVALNLTDTVIFEIGMGPKLSSLTLLKFQLVNGGHPGETRKIDNLFLHLLWLLLLLFFCKNTLNIHRTIAALSQHYACNMKRFISYLYDHSVNHTNLCILDCSSPQVRCDFHYMISEWS